MSDDTLQATREFCDSIDDLLKLAKENRVSIRAVTLIELARADLQERLNDLEVDFGESNN